MKQDEIIEMAQTLSHGWWLDDQKLESFAKLIAAKEREACASVCARHAKVYSDLPKTLTTDIAWASCIDIRDAIRARGEA